MALAADSTCLHKRTGAREQKWGGVEVLVCDDIKICKKDLGSYLDYSGGNKLFTSGAVGIAKL